MVSKEEFMDINYQKSNNLNLQSGNELQSCNFNHIIDLYNLSRAKINSF